MNLRKHTLLCGLVALLVSVGALSGRTAVSQRFAVTTAAARPFEPGEELIYKAEISRSLLRKLDVATFRFVATRVTNESGGNADSLGSVALRLTGDVASQGFFTKLFNINFHQHIESTVDPDSLTVRKTVKLDEQGKRRRTSEAVFDQKTGKVTWTERDPNDPSREPRVVTTDFTGTVHDVVSAIYYLRTQHLPVGKNFEVPVSDSGRVYQLPVRVVEKKRMKTVLGSVPVVRVDPELFGSQGMISVKGQFSIWLTDDQRHIPVKAQIKTAQGMFDITLKKAWNQSDPLVQKSE